MLHFALAPACFIYPIRLTEKKTFPKQIFVLYWKYKFDNTKIYIWQATSKSKFSVSLIFSVHLGWPVKKACDGALIWLSSRKHQVKKRQVSFCVYIVHYIQ